ncbi:TIGR03086 family metal-binding protein [Streptomyces collinus]
MPTTPVTAFAEVLDTLVHLVESVEEERWSSPTPCADWNVRQLVEHLMAGQHTFAAAMGAGPSLPPVGADATSEGLKKTFRASSAVQVAAFERPGALERTVQVPIGEVPGTVALRLQTLEHLAHGWDLARATGRKALFDEATVERETEFAHRVTAQLPPGPGAPFAPARTAPEDASALDRLAALLGRDVTG